MANFIVMAQRFGFAVIEADCEEEAIKNAQKMEIEDFDWEQKPTILSVEE